MVFDAPRRVLLGKVLRDVSRSFYLTLGVIPRAIRPQVGTAYLLARAADTIADTESIAQENRLVHLLSLRRQLQRKPLAEEIAAIQHDLLAHRSSAAESRLLEKLNECFALYQSFDPPDRRLIAEVVTTLMQGMENDLHRFGGKGSTLLRALETDEELDKYTYQVAGCVGQFWTKLCVSHLPALRNWDIATMIEKGIRFGKGLQLTNILRDLPRDLRNGRCYLPAKRLGEVRLQPRDLLNRESLNRLRPLLDEYLDRAMAHLEVGWQYTMAVPRRLPRLRLACVWPIWIGLQTLARIRHHPSLLDASVTVKVSRDEIYKLMARSAAFSLSDRALTRRYEKLRAEVLE